MPWTVTDTMTQRCTFILEYQEGFFSMTERCQRFNISRKTGYNNPKQPLSSTLALCQNGIGETERLGQIGFGIIHVYPGNRDM